MRSTPKVDRRADRAIDAFEARRIGCMVITGSDKAFAAGADIKEMAGQELHGRLHGDFAATGIASRACASR